MKNIIKIAVLGVLITLVVSCQNDKKPNYQYMPNMYESVGYEAYSKHDIFEPVTGGSSAMDPADGSVARGWLPYEIENSLEGYAFAKANLKNTTPYTEDSAAKGEELYTIYCSICHGKKGAGQGTLVKREKILGVPAYNDAGRAITEGSVYHVMYYGINSMGSYASQMTEDELWMVNHYVMSLKDKLDGLDARPFDVVKDVMEVEMVDNHIEEIHEDDNHQAEEH
jgi:mono/diheme cytochrome c family protein